MSTLKVDGIRSNSASSDAITLASDGTCTANITSINSVVMPNSGSLSNRNKIYNGKMEIDQRNHGSSTNIEGNTKKYHLDRWAIDGGSLDELSAGVQRVDEAPEGSGFVRSLKITTNTPESSLTSGEVCYLSQRLEGQDLQDLLYNTSSAKAVTMSFWVRSSLTGTYGFTIYRDEPGTDRIINKTYTINSANTWEKKIITIAGDTGRGIQNTNTSVWWNVWHLAAGSDYTSSTASSWENYTGAKWAGGHAQNGVITTNGATWQITGVQLEVGSVATDFEHRSYGQELELCRRYYQLILDRAREGEDDSGLGGTPYSSTSGVYCPVRFHPIMRTKPTVESSSASDGFRTRHGDLDAFDSFSGFNTATRGGGTLLASADTGKTVGHFYWIETNTSSGKLAVSAEL